MQSQPSAVTSLPGARQACVCEPLEARQLLAADIVATEVTGRLPPDLVSGTRGRIPGIGVRLQNAGDTAVNANNVAIRLLASADGTPDAGDAILADQTTRLRMAPGGHRQVPIRLAPTVPDVAANAYRLIAQVDVTNVVPEDNEGNNSVAMSGLVATVTIGPPFINLTATGVSVGNFVRSGRPARLAFTVLNAGNTNARGTGIVNVLFRPASATTGGTADDVTVRINVRARKQNRLVGRIDVPAGLTAGQYTVIATLTSVTGFTESVTTDNTANGVVTMR